MLNPLCSNVTTTSSFHIKEQPDGGDYYMHPGGTTLPRHHTETYRRDYYPVATIKFGLLIF